jgi:drug/metabolite transporter (DMT)-like permease
MLSKARHEIFLACGALFFAFNGVPSKLIMETKLLSATRLTEIRTIGAFLVLLTFVLLRSRKSLLASKSEIAWLIAFGLVGFTAVNLFYFLSIQRLHVSIALIIEFTSPIWISLFLKFILKKPVSKLMWWGLTIGFIGLILLAQVWKGTTLDTLGVIYAIIDAFAMTGYFLIGERLLKVHPRPALLVWGLGVSSLFFLIVQPIWSYPTAIFHTHVHLVGRFAGAVFPGWALILWVIFFGTVVPYGFVLSGLHGLSASTSSVIGMLEPIFAGIFAWIILQENLTTWQLIGAAIILVGIYLADKAKSHT